MCVFLQKTSEEWRIVFYISSAVSIFGAIIYGLFSNSEVAKWADINTDMEIEVDAPNIDDEVKKSQGAVNINGVNK